jgi:hypothetical protein
VFGVGFYTHAYHISTRHDNRNSDEGNGGGEVPRTNNNNNQEYTARITLTKEMSFESHISESCNNC